MVDEWKISALEERRTLRGKQKPLPTSQVQNFKGVMSILRRDSSPRLQRISISDVGRLVTFRNKTIMVDISISSRALKSLNAYPTKTSRTNIQTASCTAPPIGPEKDAL